MVVGRVVAGGADEQFEGGQDAEEQAADERLKAEAAEAGQVVDDAAAGKIIDHDAAPEEEEEAGGQAGPWEVGDWQVGDGAVVAVVIVMVAMVVVAVAVVTVMVVCSVAAAGWRGGCGVRVVVVGVRVGSHGSIGAGVGRRISRRRRRG